MLTGVHRCGNIVYMSVNYGLLDIDFDAERQRLVRDNVNRANNVYNDCVDEYNAGVSAADVYAGLPVPVQRKIASRLISFGSVESSVVSDFEHYLQCGDPVVARFLLMTSESRQGWQERLQFSVLSAQSRIVVDWRDPSNRAGEKLPKAKKTIDFTGVIPSAATASGASYPLYVAAKYTQENGGAQDNQCDDLLSFAESAKHYCEQSQSRTVDDDGAGDGDDSPRRIIVLLADGEYYQRTHKRLGGMDFHSYVHSKYAAETNYNLVVTDTAHFDVELGKLLKLL